MLFTPVQKILIYKYILLKESNTRFVGKVLFDLPKVPSTNIYALELLSKTKPVEGTVISTYNQTHGRGQIGSSWESAPGKNLSLSFIFYPFFLAPVRQFMLGKIFALAARDLVNTHLPANMPAFIKWPNDIIVNGRKVGGILVQNSIQGNTLQFSVGGVGLNVNQQDFKEYFPPATSLLNESGISCSLETLRDELCALVEVYYDTLRSGDYAAIDHLYLQHLLMLDQPAIFQRQIDQVVFEGKIRGITETGTLIIEHGNTQENFGFKEIRLLTFSK